MELRTILHSPHTYRARLIVLAVTLSLAAAASSSLYNSPFTPLLLVGALAALAICVAWLQKPVRILYVAVLVAFLPEGLLPATIHSGLNRLLLLVALIFWLFDVLLHRRRVVWTRSTLLMIGFLLWGAITLLWAPDLHLGVGQWLQYACRIVLYLLLLINQVDRPETLNKLMGALALSGWLLILAGVGSILSAGYQPGRPLRILDENINAFGSMLLMTMSGVIWQALAAPRARQALYKALAALYLLLAIILVALGGSRGSAIALMVTTLAFWFWKPTRFWGKLGLIILVVAAISAPFVFTTVVHRFITSEEGALGGRQEIWAVGWQMIGEHPWLGIGIGNASSVLAASNMVARYVRILDERPQLALHNAVLQVWADTGLPGILLYLGALLSAAWSFLRHLWRRRGADSARLVAYAAVVSCIGVSFMLLWVETGGIEQSPAYFLLLALLLLPERLGAQSAQLGIGD